MTVPAEVAAIITTTDIAWLETRRLTKLWQELGQTTPYMDVRVYEDAARLRDVLQAALAQQAEPDHETRAELAEQQVVQLAEERDHYRNLWQKAQQDEPAQDSGFWGRVAARQASRIKQLETAVQQALEVLKFCTPKPRPTDDDYAERGWKEHNAAITALRAALAQQDEPVEPVAWMYTGIKQDGTEHGPHLVWRPEYMDSMSASKGAKATPLYTTPPQRSAEPVKEPIGYLWPTGRHPEFRFTQQKRDGVDGTPVYTAPPQRKQAEPVEEGK